MRSQRSEVRGQTGARTFASRLRSMSAVLGSSFICLRLRLVDSLRSPFGQPVAVCLRLSPLCSGYLPSVGSPTRRQREVVRDSARGSIQDHHGRHGTHGRAQRFLVRSSPPATLSEALRAGGFSPFWPKAWPTARVRITAEVRYQRFLVLRSWFIRLDVSVKLSATPLAVLGEETLRR